jgi:hypothetical protein
MDTKPRLTKQGIRDLNHYGPRPDKAQAPAPAASGAEASASPVLAPKESDAALPIDA